MFRTGEVRALRRKILGAPTYDSLWRLRTSVGLIYREYDIHLNDFINYIWYRYWKHIMFELVSFVAYKCSGTNFWDFSMWDLGSKKNAIFLSVFYNVIKLSTRLLQLCGFFMYMMICGSFTMLFLYTTEVLPTSIRSQVFGIISAFGRLGSALGMQIVKFPLYYSRHGVKILWKNMLLRWDSIYLKFPIFKKCQKPN